ncbi:RDD family protein [Mycobacterium seoulense]|uniref:Membrane protein n=1 Tax=Mycobacterium seoulense TaxID=386911 RepID=A0A7I7P4E6_9MYCO|nr:RDD family protein [Mycobacterium seoulense]MCV7438702.1 RDD family protein [Mycobacterium seoulense]BBY03757.1 membrane protein [Mycobacterium seoulense]
MTVVVEKPPALAVEEFPRNALAPWHLRAGALAVDILPGAAVVATMALVCFTVPFGGVWWWVGVTVGGLAILLMLVNRSLLPAVTGWSLGRGLFGIAVARRDGETIGPWGLLLRDLAHLFDTVSLVGWLWPLWDSGRRTFADMLLRTEVRRRETAEPSFDARRWTAVVALGAAGLSLAGAAMSYGVVFAPDRATDRTRAELDTQGPKMVAQMLTYDPKSLHDDFARALSLATDKYRTQLAAQQDTVQKGNPVINEYWVTDHAIQSASPDRATMLMFMQGRRGAAPDERYISATVRVTFAKAGGGRWLVDDLTVLTKPKPPGGGK